MKECIIDECHREAFALGMCNKHYLHKRRYGTPYAKRDMSGLYKKFPREFNSYRSMKNRCLCKTDKNYPRWGGRGINICDRWLGPCGFKNFLSDMGPRPDNTTLDRTDNSKGYSPKNCRWANAWKQTANTRRLHGRTPGVYYIKKRDKWCANLKIDGIRLTKSCATKDMAIRQRRKWEEEYLPCRNDQGVLESEQEV